MGRTGKPHIVVALQLNGATGRNEFLGISRFLSHGRSWNLTLAQSADDVNAALARNEVDGAIVGLLHDARTLELVASSRIPTVLIMGYGLAVYESASFEHVFVEMDTVALSNVERLSKVYSFKDCSVVLVLSLERFVSLAYLCT